MESRTVLLACVVAATVFATYSVSAAPQKAAAPQKVAAPQKPAESSGVYTTKYDNIDVEQVLASKRLVNNYVQCLLDQKPCSPEGAELRKILPDALKTLCSKCSDKHKTVAIKVVGRLEKEYPKEWKQLRDKWDPKGDYYKKFLEFLEEEKNKPAKA